jgi:hypothetical protein
MKIIHLICIFIPSEPPTYTKIRMARRSHGRETPGVGRKNRKSTIKREKLYRDSTEKRENLTRSRRKTAGTSVFPIKIPGYGKVKAK